MNKNSGLEVIYEDRRLIAVNKPAGMLSVATDSEKLRTAYALLRESMPRYSRVFVVHRLDRETSGVLLFAKSAEVRDALQANWGQTPLREYIALCSGRFAEKSGRIESWLRESAAHRVYSVRTPEGAKKAITNYEVINEKGPVTALRVSIETGRKNQIRVQLSEAGHPVLGDRKYGPGRAFPRLALHASRLDIALPEGGTLTLRAPLPKEFEPYMPRG